MSSPIGASTARAVPTMAFIGVTTGQSSIMRIFPRWAEILGIPQARLVGYDVALDAAPQEYRQIVEQIRADPLFLGALITTHKVNLFAATQDLFDGFDEHAHLTEEISAIYKRNGRLLGSAKDPLLSGRALVPLLPPGYFGRTGGETLILGAGGAGVAIAVHLLTRPHIHDQPTRITVVDRSPERLNALQRITARISTDATARIRALQHHDAAQNDRVMQELPPGSLVVNATGMGKDRPGSPISDAAQFPERGIVWELNYRGALDFLHQARHQAVSRALTVEDGWFYFLHGWSEIVTTVFDIELTPARFAALRAAAEPIR